MEGIVNAAMNISEFIEIANGLNVLGIKITKDNETVAEWHSEDECRRIYIQLPRVLHLAR